ncbi:hypothetical protein PR202_gb11826 [Eleusine coracana subsp. coracana]|uniref:Uncharacterized protein n=1 Tax=Eleusine coracana subsp. coracana TaxID=191504 RepID=A0AAV5EMW3_ELECO|nr:hypothetical protein PR202_gb11826 [Eleusine coracana subsp. coracana]
MAWDSPILPLKESLKQSFASSILPIAPSASHLETSPASPLETSSSPPPPPLAMANFPIDPRPLTPDGFMIVLVHYLDPPDRTRVFMGALHEKCHENIAVATFFPRMDKRDFKVMARELHRELLLRHQEVMFQRHDEMDNARSLDIDREVWLILVGYPLDARSHSTIAKSIASFALLKHVHESEVLARVIAKAVLHDDRRIPPDVVISTGSGPHTRSWTVPVYLLSRQDEIQVADEEGMPQDGIAHPMPPYAPRWMGPVGDWLHDGESQGDHAPMEQDQVAPMDGQPENVLQNFNIISSNGTIPGATADFEASSGVKDPMDHDLMAEKSQSKSASTIHYAENQPKDCQAAVIPFGPAPPPVINEPEAFKVASDNKEIRLEEPKTTATYLGQDKRDGSEREEELLITDGSNFPKRSPGTDGLVVDGDQQMAEEALQLVTIAENPKPIQMVPPSTNPSPFFSQENIQALAVGFVKMDAGAVSAEAVLADDSEVE